MPIRRLRDWMPRPGRVVEPHRHAREWPIEHYAPNLVATKLEPDKAVDAWTRLAAKVQGKTGVDLVLSRVQFVWEAIGTDELRVPMTTTVSGPKGAFVLLIEGEPTVGFLIPGDSLRLDDFRQHFADMVLAPWPRLGWVAMIPHEIEIGPYLLDLKG